MKRVFEFLLVLLFALTSTEFNTLVAQMQVQVQANEEILEDNTVVLCLPQQLQLSVTLIASGTPIDNLDDYTFLWEVNPGSETYTQSQPTVFLSDPGVYDISIRVTPKDSTQEVLFKEIKEAIFATPKPQANFEVQNTLGCVPLNTQLRLEAPRDTILYTYSWVVSGVGTSKAIDPEFTVQQPGTYGVALEITDTNGCTAVRTQVGAIQAKAQPMGSFTAFNQFSCGDTLKSALLPTTRDTFFNYEWRINGTLFSTEVQPDVLLTENGNYDVELTVSNELGCFNNIAVTDFFRVDPLVADLDIPDRSCIQETVRLRYDGEAADAYLWHINGERLSPGPTVEVDTTFNWLQGKNEVCVTARTFEPLCTSTACDSIEINGVRVLLEDPQQFVQPCVFPQNLRVPIQNAGSIPPGTSLTYVFNEDTVYQGIEVVPFEATISSPGDYTIKIYASKDDCEVVSQFDLTAPTVDVSFSLEFPNGSCVNDTGIVVFNRGSFFQPVQDEIFFITAVANLEDTLFKTGFQFAEAFTLSEVGRYIGTYIVNYEGGCTVAVTDTFSIGVRPNADFTAEVRDTCGVVPMQFFDSSFVDTGAGANSTLIDNWTWNFILEDEIRDTRRSKNLVDYRVAESVDTLNELTAEGLRYDVQLIASYLGCPDTITKKALLQPWGPSLKRFATTSNICRADGYPVIIEAAEWTSLKVDFIGLDSNNNPVDTTWLAMEYDTAGFDSFEKEVLHGGHSLKEFRTYYQELNIPQSHSGKLVLSLFNKAYPTCDSCVVRDTIAYQPIVKPKIVAPDTVCFSAENALTTIVCKALDAGPKYSWTLPGAGFDPYEQDADAVFTPSAPGNNVIILKNEICPEGVTKSIFAVETDVAVDVIDGNTVDCPPFSITPEATYLGSDSVVSWEWLLLSASNTQAPDTFASYVGKEPGEILFTEPGSYFLRLLAKDTRGCNANRTVGIPITSRFINLEVEVPDNRLCAGESVVVNNRTPFMEVLDLTWLNSDTVVTELYQFREDFPVSSDTLDLVLIGETENCQDTLKVEDIIIEPNPVFDFKASDTVSNCPPLITTFNPEIKSADYPYSYEWRFGTTDVPRAYSEQATVFYPTPGTYDVSLFVRTDGGCSNFVRKEAYISLTGPSVSSMDLSKNAVCPNDSFCVALSGVQGADSVAFSFGDGSFFRLPAPKNSDTSFCYAYQRGFEAPRIVTGITSLDQCEIQLQQTVNVDNVTAAIEELDVDTLCGLPNLPKIRSQSANTFQEWQLNGVDMGFNADFSITEAGKQEIILSVYDTPEGCIDYDTLEFWVFPNPDLAIDTIPTVLCNYDTLALTATGAEKYEWGPVNVFSNATSASTMFQAFGSQDITLRGTNEQGCSSVEEYRFNVSPAFVVDTLALTDSIRVGEKAEVSLELLDSITGSIYEDYHAVWINSEGLECDTCLQNTGMPLKTQEYTVIITDRAGCYQKLLPFTIAVDELYTLSMPNAFTPNSDGVNDVYTPSGLGIEELLYFKIYNRMGDLLFEGKDVQEGWNGFYQGQSQPDDSYVYEVAVRFLNGEISKREGILHLIR